MSLNFKIFVSCCVLFVSNLAILEAQLVNYEETWQEFLRKEKTANISELVEPEKSQPANYIKYALMYANTYFCGDNIEMADKMIQRIESMGTTVQDKVPGFEERYQKLKIKIKAYHDFAPLWKQFLDDKNSVSKEDVMAYPDAKTVCEKGTLCKYFYMISRDYYCDGDLENAREQFDTKVKKLMATTFDYKNVEGLGDELDKMSLLWAGMDELDPAWETFELTGVSPGLAAELPVFDCFVIPNIKACLIKAYYDLCGDGATMLKKIKSLQKINSHRLTSNIIDKIEWLESEVGSIQKDLAVLNSFWRIFTPKEILPATANFKYSFVCDREADIKAHLMDGLSKPCDYGRQALDSIAYIRKQYKPDMAALTLSKYKKLKGLVSNDEKAVDMIKEAWKSFIAEQAISESLDLSREYGHCNKLYEIRAYIIDGSLNTCNKGSMRLDDIEKVMAEYDPELDETTQEKLSTLVDKVEKQDQKQDILQQAWAYFMKKGAVSYDLEYEYIFPCDRKMEVMAYLLDGYTDPCLSANYALEQIGKVRNMHSPELDNEQLNLIKKLEEWPTKDDKNTAVLNKAWKDFDKDGKLNGKVNFVFEYCDKIAQAKAYIIDGTVNFDRQAKQRLEDMAKLRADYLLTLNKPMLRRLEWLEKEVKAMED